MHGSILILTGARGAGKSTACARAAGLARVGGYTCAGLITFSKPNDQRDVLDLSTGCTRRLTIAPTSAAVNTEDRSIIELGRFRFDAEVLAWGNAVLAATTACDLLIVDELGPLELLHGQGWSEAFRVLDRGRFALAVLVVRPELIARAQSQLAPRATRLLTLTHANREHVPEELLAALRQACSAPDLVATAHS